MSISDQQILIRLLVALAVGSLFGVERRQQRKPVGMRTHILICLSCTVITMVSAYGFAAINPGDPARLMVGLLTGIGFIGGGIIWKSSTGVVQGVTTAADILLLTALSMAIGLGLYFLVAVAALIGFITLESNRWSEAWKKRRALKGEADAEDELSGQNED